jgi:hypothetical protein
MSAAAILALTGIICAFAAFMVTLAWGERQTRNLPQPALANASIRAARPFLSRSA